MVMYLDRQKLIDDFCMNKCKLKRNECPKKQSRNQYNACEDVWLIEHQQSYILGKCGGMIEI